MMIVAVIVIMALSRSKNIPSLLEKITFLLDSSQLDLHSLKFILQIAICCLEVVSLLQPFATAILSVTTILQGSPLLFQTHHLCRTGRFVLPTNSMENHEDKSVVRGELVWFCIISLVNTYVGAINTLVMQTA